MPDTAVATLEPRADVAVITPMQMLQTAVEKGADLDQLQKLMDLQERWEANEARKAFVRALSTFKAEPPTVTKNKRAGFDSRKTGERTEYDYATLAQVAEAVAPALSRFGLSHRWSVVQDEAGIAVTCTLTHEDGHSESVTMRGPADNSGSKNSIQAIASTTTYLQRYTLLAITGLAAADMDDDGGGFDDEKIADDQRDLVLRMIAETQTDVQKFCAWLHIDAVGSMSIKDFRRGVEMLEKKQKQGKNTEEKAT